MRAVHESAYKPKISNETKFIVNIRPANRNAASLSTINNNNNSGRVGNNGSSHNAATGVNTRTNADADRQMVSVISGGGNAVQRDYNLGLNSRNSISEVNWRRIFTVSSLILSLILISGSIYLHIRQKPHLGRFNYEQYSTSISKTAVTAGEGEVAAAALILPTLT